MSAAALLYIHAGIALADAVTIRRGGVKSSSDHHQDAISLLEQVTLSDTQRREALAHFKRLITEKSRIAYSGERLTKTEVDTLAKHSGRFRAWVLETLRV
ncbi:MAG: hypothetical protein HY716_13355 [Planctomycetes bacterium]|nr:hypothetical protein [Planctomycetota bacterium]